MLKVIFISDFRKQSNMSEPKRQCAVRQYKVDYLKYGIVPFKADKTKPICLMCLKTFTNEAMKPSRIVDHFTRTHNNMKDKPLSYFQNLEARYLNEATVTSMFSAVPKQNNDGVRASYNIALMIAKSGKPHTIGEELILPAIKEVLTTVLHTPAFDVTKKLSLSNNTVQRRIDEMSENIEETLCEHLKTTRFALQVDESTLQGNESLLLSYVRFIKEGKCQEELLFARTLKTDTKGETIFKTLEDFFLQKEIPLTNILTIATDGAPAMVGRYKGLLAYMKKSVPGLLTIHCVIHRQHLVAKNLSERLHRSLQFVITAVNKIKTSAFSSRLFKQLCMENEEDFTRLLLHTEVRWLSKGACLERFYSLLNSVLEFLKEKDTVLHGHIMNSTGDIAYLADLFSKFNEVNLKLQGNELNLIKAKSILSSFVSKLMFWQRTLERNELSQFPSLKLKTPTKEDLLAYCQHLEMLHSDMCTRFEDILSLEIPDWILDPFNSCPSEGDLSPTLEEELIELVANEELKPKFKLGYQAFWLQNEIRQLYPGLWCITEKLFVAFPSSYMVERGFSAVNNLATKSRNRLEIEKRGDLRIFLTKMAPDINKLIETHQIHPSH